LIVATVQSGDKSSFRMQQRDCFGTFTLIFLHLFSCGLSAIIVAIRPCNIYHYIWEYIFLHFDAHGLYTLVAVVSSHVHVYILVKIYIPQLSIDV
jgi:hypothetical protein